MLEALLLGSLIFCGVQAQQGFEFDDSDFAAYVEMHDNFREEYGESAAKGCVAGAVKDSYKGFQALCIGCATGAAAAVTVQMNFPQIKKKDE